MVAVEKSFLECHIKVDHTNSWFNTPLFPPFVSSPREYIGEYWTVVCAWPHIWGARYLFRYVVWLYVCFRGFLRAHKGTPGRDALDPLQDGIRPERERRILYFYSRCVQNCLCVSCDPWTKLPLSMTPIALDSIAPGRNVWHHRL